VAPVQEDTTAEVPRLWCEVGLLSSEEAEFKFPATPPLPCASVTRWAAWAALRCQGSNPCFILIHHPAAPCPEMAFDLSRYLARIGIDAASVRADLPSLAAIEAAHLRVFSFENLGVIAQPAVPISMNLDDVFTKFVVNGRGGYCFEHNTLLQAALRAVGFIVHPVLARVRWNRAADVKTTFTHMGLIVHVRDDASHGASSSATSSDNACAAIEDTTACGPIAHHSAYLVDVGFGGIGPMAPLRIGADGSADALNGQRMADGVYRVIRAPPQLGAGSGYRMLQWWLNEAWVDLYAFRDEPALHVDLELSNWWSCTHPGARWVGCLFAARVIDRAAVAAADGADSASASTSAVATERHHLLNNEYSIRQLDGSVVRTEVAGAEQVLELLARVFGLHFPSGTRFKHGPQ
jgi:N-hydroxyarylamine O-acetyltransferase